MQQEHVRVIACHKWRDGLITTVMRHSVVTGNLDWPRIGFAAAAIFQICLTEIHRSANHLGVPFGHGFGANIEADIAAGLRNTSGNFDLARLWKVCQHLGLSSFSYMDWIRLDVELAKVLPPSADAMPKARPMRRCFGGHIHDAVQAAALPAP